MDLKENVVRLNKLLLSQDPLYGQHGFFTAYPGVTGSAASLLAMVFGEGEPAHLAVDTDSIAQGKVTIRAFGDGFLLTIEIQEDRVTNIFVGRGELSHLSVAEWANAMHWTDATFARVVLRYGESPEFTLPAKNASATNRQEFASFWPQLLADLDR